MSLEYFTEMISGGKSNAISIYNILSKVKISRLIEITYEIDSLSKFGPEKDFQDAVHNFIFIYPATKIGFLKNRYIFRSRRHNQNVQFYKNISDLKYPPEEKVLTIGRFNKIYNPIYYAATDMHIAVLETTIDSYERKPEGHCTVVGSIINDNILNLTNLYPEHITTPIYRDSIEALIVGLDTNKIVKDKLGDDIYSKVLFLKKYVADRITSDKNNTKFDCYKITSEIAELLIQKFSLLGFVYPTVVGGYSKSCVALLPNVYDMYCSPSIVYRLKYKYHNSLDNCTEKNSILCSHTLTHRAYKIRRNGRILWSDKVAEERRVDISIKSGVPMFTNYNDNKLYNKN